ncbi:uncharacterized protein PV09_07713 [Verruconis gallopava]|uniref:Protein FYV10 n=1 Tax=Verruconis gallopava TaxID=253628 RepID=A0A0D2A1U7_9PEZI|nr:uncharacterized protein PV09_07713 [Verruconis gallopava]KIW00728.1 hypothetical protein PV09_07713 [Verruconis gallopava]
MTEYESIKLDHEKHLLLDQPLLRLPTELSRHNLKTAQIQIKSAQDKVTEIISAGTKATAQASAVSQEDAASKATASLDQAINRLQTLKRKLSALNSSTEQLYRQSAARVQHLEDLYKIPSLADVKYEEWSRIRLDRLLIDYLLRMGYTESAKALAREKNIEDLVDCDAFEQCRKVEQSLRIERRVDAALAWCNENKGTLKKMGSNTLEYELRLQQYVELARTGHRTGDLKKFNEATTHAKKYLSSHPEWSWKTRAAMLLAIPPAEDIETQNMDIDDPYNKLYSPTRWSYLSSLFLETHHSMYQLPQSPLLHMALTAGLSALKTPACHSKYISPTSGLNSSPSHLPSGALSPPLRDDFDSMDGVVNGSNGGAEAMNLSSSVCPICSTELNKLSKHLPFAHHGKSHVEHDPVMLPNGHVYGRERLERLSEKLGTREGWVKDPIYRDTEYKWEEVQKVFFL